MTATTTQLVVKHELKSDTKKLDHDSNEQVKESLRLIEDLKFFLATAPANWQENQVIRRYYLNHDEGFVSCVYWNNLYFITGTDIVRCIVYKFEHFGRKIIDRKKFEEGIFSDLRNLKCHQDAILESPRSEFLNFLFKNACLRTQKKQKVFFWFNVPHDKLMADALERDFKKEKAGQNPTTISHREPALSFNYDENKSLYDQLAHHMDLQKKLNQSDDQTNSSTLSDPDSDQRSPEYTSTTTSAAAAAANTNTNANSNDNNDAFDFLDHETPAQYKNGSDYEDDFPLDYFDQEDSNDKNNFITLDSNFQVGYINGFDENYDNLVDPSIFTNPTFPTPVASQLVFNDEYLIEQTQPLKTPLPPPNTHQTSLHLDSQNQQHLPTTQIIPAPPPAHIIHSSTQDFFPIHDPYHQPPSAKFQPRFYNEPPLMIQNHQQPPPQHLFQPMEPIPYGYSHPDQEYWPQPAVATTPAPPSAGPSQQSFYPDQFPVPQPYIYYNDAQPQPDIIPSSGYHYMDPNFMPIPNNPPTYLKPNDFAPPSTRQQQISANMMKKKRQLQQQSRLKNQQNHVRGLPEKIDLDEVVSNKSTTKVVNFKDINNKDANEMPTPESSIGNPDSNYNRQVK